MEQRSEWPVVKPLPQLVVRGILCILFFVGHVLLFKDRAKMNIDNSIGVPVASS